MLLLTGLSEGLFSFLNHSLCSSFPLIWIMKHYLFALFVNINLREEENKLLDVSENIQIENSKEAMPQHQSYQGDVLNTRKLIISIEIHYENKRKTYTWVQVRILLTLYFITYLLSRCEFFSSAIQERHRAFYKEGYFN